jgi:hypothetical protein
MSVVGVAPFQLRGNGSSIGSLSLVVVIDALLGLIAILKGKPLLGVIGVFIPLVSLVGAVRLAAPNSRWARRRYDLDGRKLSRARERWQRIQIRRRWIADLVVGAPHAPSTPSTPSTPPTPSAKD